MTIISLSLSLSHRLDNKTDMQCALRQPHKEVRVLLHETHRHNNITFAHATVLGFGYLFVDNRHVIHSIVNTFCVLSSEKMSVLILIFSRVFCPPSINKYPFGLSVAFSYIFMKAL